MSATDIKTVNSMYARGNIRYLEFIVDLPPFYPSLTFSFQTLSDCPLGTKICAATGAGGFLSSSPSCPSWEWQMQNQYRDGEALS